MTMMTTAATPGAKSEFEKKVRRGIFNPVARYLRSDIQEDRLAEGIGMAFEQYARSVERGEPMPDAILVQACRVRAIDLGRRLAGAQGAVPKADVLDERNYHTGRVEVLRLDGILDGNEDDEEPGLIGFAEVESQNPARRIVSALDLDAWLRSLPDEDRLLLALRQAGHTLGGIASALGRSTSWAFARLRQLGLELAELAGVDVDMTRVA